jgi:8-oxo-dGTP pyrophosphatase MutT (NUDIX family)
MSENGLAVRAIVLRDGQLLVMQRNKFGKKYITLPGGGVEPGETPKQAVVREVEEETGLDIKVVRQVYKQKPFLVYSAQWIYLCETNETKEPKLTRGSIEYKLTKTTGNKFKPLFLPVESIRGYPSPFFPGVHFDEIEHGLKNGFPEEIKTIG